LKERIAMKGVLRLLDRECRRLQNKEHAKKMAKYFKYVHPFYGIKTASLRQMIRQVQSKYQKDWNASSLLDTAEQLLAESQGEKKLLGVYLLGVNSNLKILQNDPIVIDRLGGFIETYVQDWATCDGLSTQVVRKLIEKNPAHATSVQTWCTCSNDWKQRASCVSFVCLARHGAYNDLIVRIVAQVIQNRARFPQLGAGWVLRELSLADEPRVVTFITKHYTEFTREGLRYAIEKMDKPLQQKMLKYEPRREDN